LIGNIPENEMFHVEHFQIAGYKLGMFHVEHFLQQQNCSTFANKRIHSMGQYGFIGRYFPTG